MKSRVNNFSEFVFLVQKLQMSRHIAKSSGTRYLMSSDCYVTLAQPTGIMVFSSSRFLSSDQHFHPWANHSFILKYMLNGFESLKLSDEFIPRRRYRLQVSYLEVVLDLGFF